MAKAAGFGSVDSNFVLAGVRVPKPGAANNNQVLVYNHAQKRWNFTSLGSGGGGDMLLASAQTSTGKKTFQPNATNAGINIGTFAGNPSTLTNGDFWYNSTTHTFNGYANGAVVSFGAGGGGGSGDMVLASVQTSTGKKTFQPNATNAGINIGTFAGNPSTLTNGDFWYNSSTGVFHGVIGDQTRIMPYYLDGAATLTNRIMYVGNNGGGIATSGNLLYSSGSGTLTINNINAQGRITVKTTSTSAGLNIGAFAGNPSALTNGDFWYNSTTHTFNGYANGAVVSFGAGGGGGSGDMVLASVQTSTGKKTFQPNATNAGINFGNGKPTTIISGDAWHDLTAYSNFSGITFAAKGLVIYENSGNYESVDVLADSPGTDVGLYFYPKGVGSLGGYLAASGASFFLDFGGNLNYIFNANEARFFTPVFIQQRAELFFDSASGFLKYNRYNSQEQQILDTLTIGQPGAITYGTTAPDNANGNDGDIYIQYTP